MPVSATHPNLLARQTGVVFVNFHSESLIIPRAERLVAEGHDVVVADNSATYSGPGKVVSMGGNRGFGRACNAAVAALGDEVSVVCLHNPDLDVPKGGIQELARRLRCQRRPGIVAPAERTGGIVRRRGYHYPSPVREAVLAGRPFRLAARRRAGVWQGISGSAPWRGAASAPVVAFSGTGRRFSSAALVVIDREAWKALEGFDERYFLYYEDLDLWHRLGVAGYDREFRSDLVVNHHYGSGSPTSATRRELCRWLGVELFCETFEPDSWRAMRRVHHLFLGRHRRACPGLSSTIDELWSSGLGPSEVMAAMYEALARPPITEKTPLVAPSSNGAPPRSLRCTVPSPEISVVVPTYNRSASLRRLLRSIADSSVPEGGVEVIVVDDGSTDDTQAVAVEAGARCIRQSNAGPAAARQLGWRSARGSRIVFVDDDCVLDSEALRVLAAALDEADGVGADIVPVDRTNLVADFMHVEGIVHSRVVDGRIRWLVTAAVAFRRDALEQVGGFDMRFPRATGEDVDLTLRLLAAGFRLRLEPLAVVHHDHRTRLLQLASTYFRHGTAQRLLAAKHPVHRSDNYRTAFERANPADWVRAFRGYRREASVARSLSFVALRAAMLVPYAAGAIVGERRRPVLTV